MEAGHYPNLAGGSHLLRLLGYSAGSVTVDTRLHKISEKRRGLRSLAWPVMSSLSCTGQTRQVPHTVAILHFVRS